MAPNNVVRRGEILIGTTRLKVRGKIRIANISVTPNPLVLGDTIRQGDTQVMSQLIQITATGGSGIYRANSRTDLERFWTSGLETRYRLSMSLPPLTYSMGKPAGLTNQDVFVSRAYGGNQYVVFGGGKLYRWDDGTAIYNDNGTVVGGWSALIATLAGNPLDSRVFQGYMYFSFGTSTQKMTTSGGTEVVSAVPGAATYLQVWDEKLWKMYLNAGVWTVAFTSLGGASGEVFTNGGTLPTGVTPTQLGTFRNVAGDEVLSLLTNAGLWLYDATAQKWRETEVRIPEMPTGQRSVGSIFRDGRLYFTTGNMGVIAVQPGNPFVITPVGLDRDDGMPTVESGRVAALVADFNWLLALVDGSAVTEEDTMDSGLGMPFDTPEWSTTAGQMTLRAYAGGWNTIWQSPSSASPGFVLDVSGAYAKRRIYWSTNTEMFCQDLPISVHNPRFNPTAKFAPGPLEHISSWYDYGSDVWAKIQGHFFMRTTGCSANEIVTVYYQTDLVETGWTLLGAITTNGLQELKPGGESGIQCRLIRFRFVMQRGSDATKSPRIEFWAADFMRVLPATYGFVCTVDLSSKYAGQSPAQMMQAMKDYSDPQVTPGMIPFTYQDEYGDSPQTYYGRVSRLQGETHGGADDRERGWMQLSFMVPYLRDAV